MLHRNVRSHIDPQVAENFRTKLGNTVYPLPVSVGKGHGGRSGNIHVPVPVNGTFYSDFRSACRFPRRNVFVRHIQLRFIMILIFGPQDDVAAFCILDSCQVRAFKRCVFNTNFAFVILYVDQIRKVKILAALQHSAVFNGNMVRSQHDAAAGIDLPFNADAFIFVCIPFHPGVFQLAVFIPGTKVLKIIDKRRGKTIVVPCQIVKVSGTGSKSKKFPCIDHALIAHNQTVGTDKIQVAADTPVFDPVHDSVDINTVLNQIDQAVGFQCAIPGLEMHIDYIAVCNLVIGKPVNAKIFVCMIFRSNKLLQIQVVDMIRSINQRCFPSWPIGYFRGIGRHGLQQDTCQHQRYDPLGGGMGPLRQNRQGTAAAALDCGSQLPHGAKGAGSQLAHNGFDIIFPVVLRYLRNHYVTFPRFTPDNFVNPVHHKPPSEHRGAVRAGRIFPLYPPGS